MEKEIQRMKTHILIYEGFAHFEVMLASYLMKTAGDIVTVGVEGTPVASYEGFQLIPHLKLGEIDPREIDVFLVPGGDAAELEGCGKLHELLAELDRRKKIVGGICSGTLQLAKAGILKNRKYTTTLDTAAHAEFEPQHYIDRNTVTDGNVITAKAAGYVDFALELGTLAGIYKDEADYRETIDFFKYFKS
ncbi:DJ-1/PfpI family protein [Saccharibacillus sp. CPCC 101409]|uniref:DJ-1/PfpI family protein n=1 Tax=Saccharibacillus sp. CPCC 101409 TaxID=3058041 RepID=UPI002672E0C1|nr:DJ-1/PfpI family protein [Saccharibacillus sp. CPCC 101409]MDO3412447.1 DJ-1/PfpI family protein [Saccharibacillus sp. CPCC 101409]